MAGPSRPSLLIIVTLLCLAHTCAAGILSKCFHNYFDCGPRDICIGSMFVCDGELDCDDGRDEVNCDHSSTHFGHIKCAPDQFRCNGTILCLPNKWICDGHFDCPFKEDERDCAKRQVCNGFKCERTSKCIAAKSRCDGRKDCDDGSDERNCHVIDKNVRDSKLCLPEKGHFQCTSGRCLSHEFVCDDHAHCPSKEDEGINCSNNKLACKTAGCSHECMATPQGVQCFCPDGFQLQSNQRTCADINECEFKLDQCHQYCINTNGSYLCTCDYGYNLASDNHTCEAAISEPLLIFSDGRSVRGRWLRSKRYFEFIGNRTQAMGVDMYMQNQKLFWTQVQTNKPAVYSMIKDQIKPKLLVSAGLHTPEDVAVDWIGQNLYITDAGLRKMIVCEWKGLYCRTLFDQLDSPRSVVVWPQNATVFWTDWGERPGVYAGVMDGSHRWTLVSRDIVWPNGIAFDEPLKRLYWADAKLERIEYYDLGTGQRQIFLDKSEFHPFSLDVFEGQLYWSDWLHYKLDTVSKFDNRNISTLVKESSHVFGVRVMHPVRQRHFTHMCHSERCSHLCLLATGNRSACACPEHMLLSDDQATCVDKEYQDAILYADMRQIYRLHPDAIGKDKMALLLHEYLPEDFFLIDDFTYDPIGKQLFIYQAINALVRRLNLDNHHWTTVMTNVSNVLQLTFDPFSNNLYWIDKSVGSVHMSSSDGVHRRTLIPSLDQPTAFTLFPEQDRMFVACSLDDHRPAIVQFDTLGRNQSVVVANVGKVTSMHVCRDTQRLFWSDVLTREIRSVSVHDATDNRLVANGLQTVQSIAVSRGKVYWFDQESTLLHFRTVNQTMSAHSSLPVEEFEHSLLGFNRRMQALPTYPVVNACANSTNECQFLCSFAGFKHPQTVTMVPTAVNITTSASVRCVCPDGSVTDEPNSHGHCERMSVCDPGLFHCQSDGQCIQSSKICDGHRHCANGEDEQYCGTSGCLLYETSCNASNPKAVCVPNSWFCDGDADCPDGSDELNCDPKSKSKNKPMSTVLKTAVNGSCPDHGFLCDGHFCLNWHKVCDQHVDCTDGSDEHEECLIKCACKNNGRCYQSNTTWSCHCMPGYTGDHCEHLHVRDLNVTAAPKITSTSGRVVTSQVAPMQRETSNIQNVIILVFAILVVIFAIIGILAYYFEADGHLTRITRRFHTSHPFSLRSPGLFKPYSQTDARANLLSNMEEDIDENFKNNRKIDL